MKYAAMIYFLILSGCDPDFHDQVYPLETVECTHPDSRYEAVVKVSVDDKKKWNEIIFLISQDGYEWDTSLWEPDEIKNTWDSRMQLYELNCTEAYDYEFKYIK
mgnify:CR=1 FL=1